MNLINIFSELDFISKYIGISFKDQLLRKFGILFKFQYIIILFSIIRMATQNFLINDNSTELLVLLADPGYYIGRNNTRIMDNMIYIAFDFNYLLLIFFYSIDNFEWLLNMNRIFNDIKTDSIDEKILKSVNKVKKFLKFINIYNSFMVSLLFFIVWIINLSKDYFFSNLFFLIEALIIANFGSFVISRLLSVYYMICKILKICFNEVNHDFEIALKSGNINELKNLFEKHNKICELTYEANKALRPIFIIYSSTMSSFTVYSLYQILFSKSSTYTIINAIILMNNILFTSLTFLLSLITGNIDFEAKKAFHLIHGYVKYLFGSRILFQVLI
jgi:hypothetical protein